MIKLLLVATVLSALGLVATESAMAQSKRGGDSAYGQATIVPASGSDRDRARESAGQDGSPRATGAAAPLSTEASSAVPQFWLADAEIFIGNAHNTASVMKEEHALSVQAPQVIGSQAQFLVSAAQRAIVDLSGLEEQAAGSNSAAVAPIRRAIDHLRAAETQASRLTVQASRGALGPDYQTTIDATTRHLANARTEIGVIAQSYLPP